MVNADATWSTLILTSQGPFRFLQLQLLVHHRVVLWRFKGWDGYDIAWFGQREQIWRIIHLPNTFINSLAYHLKVIHGSLSESLSVSAAKKHRDVLRVTWLRAPRQPFMNTQVCTTVLNAACILAHLGTFRKTLPAIKSLNHKLRTVTKF